MKLAELSRTANVGYKTLANAEASCDVISYEFAAKLAKVLPDTTPEELLQQPAGDPEEDAAEAEEANDREPSGCAA